jgi:hypothetical protein
VDGLDRPRSVCGLGQAVTTVAPPPSPDDEPPPSPSGSVATLDADHGKPGELMRLIADGLTASGLDVRPPVDAGGCRLTIGCPGARCAVSANDCGDVAWEWRPLAGGEADPKLVADVATTLLTGRRPTDHPRLGNGYGRSGITFKGIVGLELKARGFDVGLAVYHDEEYFDARAEIVVTSPGTVGEAQVHVTDDGGVTWSRDYHAESAATIRQPGSCGSIADPGKLASAVVATITRAMTHLSRGSG